MRNVGCAAASQLRRAMKYWFFKTKFSHHLRTETFYFHAYSACLNKFHGDVQGLQGAFLWHLPWVLWDTPLKSPFCFVASKRPILGVASLEHPRQLVSRVKGWVISRIPGGFKCGMEQQFLIRSSELQGTRPKYCMKSFSWKKRYNPRGGLCPFVFLLESDLQKPPQL